MSKKYGDEDASQNNANYPNKLSRRFCLFKNSDYTSADGNLQYSVPGYDEEVQSRSPVEGQTFQTNCSTLNNYFGPIILNKDNENNDCGYCGEKQLGDDKLKILHSEIKKAFIAGFNAR